MQICEFWTRITNFYGSQTLPVVLCIQNSVISTRITSLDGSQPSSVVSACRTATSGLEKHVSMGPRHDQSFSAFKTVCLASELLVSMGPSPHLWFFSCKTATLGPDIQVCMGPRPHLLFWALISACIAKSLWFQSPNYGFCMQNSDFRTRISSLYGSNTRPALCACRTVCLASKLLVSMGPSFHLWFLHTKQHDLHQIYKSLWVQNLTCHFVHAKQRT